MPTSEKGSPTGLRALTVGPYRVEQFDEDEHQEQDAHSSVAAVPAPSPMSSTKPVMASPSYGFVTAAFSLSCCRWMQSM